MQRLQRSNPGLLVPIVALTAILLFMVRLPPWGYEPVQSLRVFSNLPLFAALYALWLMLLLLQLWRTRSLLLGAILVSLFSLVHVGTMVLATSYGAAEDFLKASDSVQIQRTGELDFLIYGDFPALAVVEAVLAKVTDVDIILTLRTPLLFIWLVLLSQLLLIGYFRLFKSVPLAALAVLLAVQSNIILARLYLHPMYMGVLLVVALLTFLLGREQPLSARERLVLILFMAGLTMTHFVSSAVGLVIVAGYYLERRWHRRSEVVSREMVTLAMVLVLAWAIYWAVITFSNTAAFLPEVADRFRTGTAFIYAGRVTTANVEGIPLWVTAVQTFWWVAIYLAGGLLALRNLLLQHRLSPAPPGYAGAYVVLAGVAAVGTIISPGGYDFYRIIVYGSFLAAPLVLYFLLAGRRGRILALALSGMFLALSFPTLLAHNTSISQQANRPSEVAAAQFLSRALEGKEDVPRLFGGSDKYWYYSPALTIQQTVYLGASLGSASLEEYRSAWADYVDQFLRRGAEGEETVFSFSFESIVDARHLLRMPTNDPLWGEVRQNLSEADLFYDAGRVQLYRSAPRPLESPQQLRLR